MVADKKHPDYPEYIEKCKAAAARCDAQLAQLREESEAQGLPAPDMGRMIAVRREEGATIKALREEYRHIFIPA